MEKRPRACETGIAIMRHSMAKHWSGPGCDALGLAVFVTLVPLLISRDWKNL